jgi:hypothetical protein
MQFLVHIARIGIPQYVRELFAKPLLSLWQIAEFKLFKKQTDFSPEKIA